MGALSKFVGFMRDGGMAKSSHFTVLLNLPERLNISPFTEKKEKIILFCDQAQIPGISFGSSQVRSYGEFREVPYEKLYEPITLSFYVDTGLIVKNLFDEWVSLVQDSTTRDFNYPKYYTTDTIEIHIEDSTPGNNKVNYVVKLNQCFPKAVAPIQLDYSSKDVMKCNVTLSYKYATMINTYNRGLSDQDQLPFFNRIEEQFSYGGYVEGGIPEGYISDFETFQNDFSQYASTFDGARTDFLGTDEMQDVVDPRGG